ncbi:signal peptidase I [Spongiactinospora sp. TRM90649]|uniref:signal peptidase I n=1 Tax=Spongiactinospora sp. TRM90649 TaxID=3031114 RepID=UPI0023F74939|nr:signal peptidase I [Spongiactinospora sp. TRM90649]MDF5752706.1 signal peptidase I [Spongiactinospora sp. TRM90649]
MTVTDGDKDNTDRPGDPNESAAGKPGGEAEGKADGVADGKKRGTLRETIGLIALGVVVALLLQAFVIGQFWIPSGSMENTLMVGDRVVVNKLNGAADRGDIVVFKGWDGQDTIKRVIAVGGDTVECCDAKRLSVNGVPLDETYIHPDDYPSKQRFKEKLPKGKLWVMGDHRSGSSDSREIYHGPIDEDDVIGRAFAIVWPFSRATILSRPETFDRVR